MKTKLTTILLLCVFTNITLAATITVRPLLGVNGSSVGFGKNIYHHKTIVDLDKSYHNIGVNGIRFHDNAGPGDLMCIFPINKGQPLPDVNDDNAYQWQATLHDYQHMRANHFPVMISLAQGWRNMRAWGPYPGTTPQAYDAETKLCPFWPNIANNLKQLSPTLFLHMLKAYLQFGPIDYVEVWNEPNIIGTNITLPSATACDNGNDYHCVYQHASYEWDSTPKAFFEFFASTIKALKQTYPNIKFGGPALADPCAPKAANKQWLAHFFNYMHRHHVPLDFISWTKYNSDPNSFKQCYLTIQHLLDTHGYHNTQQIIAEYGGNFRQTHPGNAHYAAIMSAIWMQLQSLPNLVQAYYYRGNDGPFIHNGIGFPLWTPYTGDPKHPFPKTHGTNPKASGIGLFYLDGKAKPEAYAFKIWADLIGQKIIANQQENFGKKNKIYFLLTKNKQHRYRLLLTVLGEKHKKLKVNINKLINGVDKLRLIKGLMINNDGVKSVDSNKIQLDKNSIKLLANRVYLFELA